MFKLKKRFIYIWIILLLIVPSVFAETIIANDDWQANEGTLTDGKLWINDNIDVETTGIGSQGDMICYDWDNSGQYDNCYWDTTGCGGGGCNANSCDYFSIPLNMNDGWKTNCTLETSCQEGVDVPERICDGCDFDTSTKQEKIIAAKVYYDCDNSAGQRAEVTVSPTFTWTVVDTHKYDCNDCSDCYNYNNKDYMGKYGTTSWRAVSSNIACPANKKCSEYFDDQESTVKTYTGFTDPCKLDDGSTSTFACTQNSDCASNNCGGDRYNYFHNCDSDGSDGFVVDKVNYDNSCGGSGYWVDTQYSWKDTTCSVEVGSDYVCDVDLEEETSSYDPMVVCRLKEYATCTSSSECWNDNGGYDCMGNAGNKICTTGANGKNCYNNDDLQCDSGRCDTTCQAKLGNGNSCDENSDCSSNSCCGDNKCASACQPDIDVSPDPLVFNIGQ